ncbi:septum site-determining protein MinC [Paraburkholderia hayleyella]|uniref:septum site-determining protein MinC n=1 Tax=Paraburkholderia hayleyella TaxID=2152889 RepID=UPI001292827F|nr:septum site-determining protein MinC [Paraburkholderia hayleyella]
MSPKKSPFFELRSGSVDMLMFVIKTTGLDALHAELTRRFEATPEFFSNDAVAIDVRRLADGERVPLEQIMTLLHSVRMRPVGVVARPAQHDWAGAAGLPLLEAPERRGAARPASEAQEASAAAETVQAAAAAPATDASADSQASSPVPAMVISKPLRSGQRVYAKGDLIVLGMVSAGAEVIAEGNIHIYAPLRGRALAGVQGNHDARIFCTCLDPELISIAGIYRTTETPLPAEVQGQAVQIWLDHEKLVIEPLRLT